ncbi:MAG: AsmA-like C-terminal region-containing protein [Synergistaceae bacterium]|nr:AsmA-like C-terminal region-containing protein [Synergistaceae bacterium]
MLFKWLKKIIIFISVIILAVLVVAVWCVGAGSGFRMLLSFLDKSEYDMPFHIYFNEVDGSILNGFTISGVTVISGDAVPGTGRYSLLGSGSLKGMGAEKLIEADRLTLKLNLPFSGHSVFIPKLVMIEGAESDFNELSSLLSYAMNVDGGGGSPVLIDFILKSSGVYNIPNMNPVSISEISLSSKGNLKLDIDVGGINISADQIIPLEQYFDLRIDSVDVKIGSAGRINLDLAFIPFTRIFADYNEISISDLLSMFKVSFDADGTTAGNSYVQFSDSGMSASGDLKLNELKVSGVPISSFSSAWNYNDSDKLLKFPKIGATIRGMEDLKGWAFMNTESAGGKFYLAGENLSLSGLERTFNLDYPVEGEKGSFHVKMEFLKENISGDIGIAIPSIVIEKQKIDNVSLAISVKNGVAEGNFRASLFGAPINGSGYFSLLPPYNINLNSMISGVESSKLAFFIPSMADAFPQGKITADIKLNGTLDSIQADGTIKSEKLSLYGLDFQKLSLSMNSHEPGIVNYKITSSGGAAINTSGQINFSEQQLKGNGSLTIDAGRVTALKKYETVGKISSEFDIAGSFSDPVIRIKLSGKNNSYYGVPIMESRVSADYSKGTLGIIESSFQLDSKSFVWIKGNVSRIAAEPVINVFGTVKNYPLALHGINGRVNGQFKVSGTASTAAITGNLDCIAEDGTGISVKISGTTKAITIEISDSAIAGGSLSGKGAIGFSGKDSPSIDFDINAVNIRVSDILKAHKVDAPLGGIFTGKIKVEGAIASPKAELTSQYPLTLNKLLLDNLYIRLSAGKGGDIALYAKTLLGEVIDLEFNGSIQKGKNGLVFNLESNNISIDELTQISYPTLRGNIEGSAKFLANIEMYPKGKMTYTLEMPQLEAFGFSLAALRVPFEYAGDEIRYRVDRGNIGGALIFGEGAVNLKNDEWKASFSIKDIYLEKLAEHILSPMGGKLTGRGEAQFELNGKIGMFAGVFGLGSFSASNGSLQGLQGMEKINKEKKFEFSSINGNFFFNGNDVNINSGAINAQAGDKLFRYIRFSGPLGISGKGMNLNFAARIDVEVLKVLINAFEGLVSLASGGNALLNPARAVTEKVLGIKINSFNDVTFDLQGSWDSPVFNNFKLDKQMSGVYEWGKNSNGSNQDHRRFGIKVNIPVGPGSSDSSLKDALQQGIFDTLFDSIAP